VQDVISALAYTDSNRLDSFFNRFMSSLRGKEWGAVVSSLIFAIYAYYLLLASIKGNWTYGSRTACFTFYALTPNET
jgi:hypothetical protein